jgi:hypothetical protein
MTPGQAAQAVLPHQAGPAAGDRLARGADPS